jgi:hypothetical protein
VSRLVSRRAVYLGKRDAAVSDKASRLSVHAPFRYVSCTDSCTRQSSGAVLKTATAQTDVVPVICGDSCGFDRRLRCIPHMSRVSHALPGLTQKPDYQLGVCTTGLQPAALPRAPEPPRPLQLAEVPRRKAEMIMATLRPARQPRCGHLSRRGRPAVPGRRPTRRNPARRRHLPQRCRLLFALF